MTTLLMASAESSSGGGSLSTIISIELLIVAFDIAMVFSAWQKGTLFNNIIRSGIVYGLPLLLAGLIVFMGFIGGNGCAGADSEENTSRGWGASYQRYYEDLELEDETF